MSSSKGNSERYFPSTLTDGLCLSVNYSLEILYKLTTILCRMKYAPHFLKTGKKKMFWKVTKSILLHATTVTVRYKV